MRLTGFLLMFGLALYTPFLAFLLASILYVLRFRGYELLILGVLIDSVFGSQLGIHGYLYTLSVGLVYLTVHVVRPYLAWSQYEMVE
jgi:cell shape-determining protein MreD